MTKGVECKKRAKAHKGNFFVKFFQEHYQTVKWFEFRSGPTSRSKLFENVISRRLKLMLARKELKHISEYYLKFIIFICLAETLKAITLIPPLIFSPEMMSAFYVFCKYSSAL